MLNDEGAPLMAQAISVGGINSEKSFWSERRPAYKWGVILPAFIGGGEIGIEGGEYDKLRTSSSDRSS